MNWANLALLVVVISGWTVASLLLSSRYLVTIVGVAIISALLPSIRRRA